MAQKIQTLFIDDIDGGEADGTVRFSLDGTEYEIDLNARHTHELRTTLNSYIEHGRKVCKAPKPLCADCVLNDICPSSLV